MRSLLVLVMITACGGGESIQDDPIPATPLAGTFNGEAWTAGSARARNAQTEGEKRIEIYPDAGLGCGFGDDPYVTVVMPWRTGGQPIDLSGDVNAMVMIGSDIYLVLDGRVELTEAPTDVGAKPTLGLRVSFQDSDNGADPDDLFAEGQIPVELCP